MGIVHHSNYLRYLEEARVAWAQERGWLDFQNPTSAFQLAVVGAELQYKKPLRFGDEFSVRLRVGRSGVRLIFEYQILVGTSELVYLSARTTHVALDEKLRLQRPSQWMMTEIKEAMWTETWL